LNAFVSGAGALKYQHFPTCKKSKHCWVVGTGGTVAGVGRYLKSKDENIIVAISDPEGSGLYNKVTN
jgi:cysteine synthase